MGTYPLMPLLRVRRFREHTAEHTVRAAEAALLAAEAAKREQEQALVAYRVWRCEEEDRRYAAIMNTCLSVDELDTFKASLAALALAEQKHEEDVVLAEAARQKAVTALAEARNALAVSRKDTAKIVAHQGIWMEEAKKQADRCEDLELEEFRALSPFSAE